MYGTSLGVPTEKIAAVPHQNNNALCVSTLTIILQEKLNQLEADLGEWRNQMALGYTNPQSGKFEKASSVQLRNTMRTDASEEVRNACWEVSRLTCSPHFA